MEDFWSDLREFPSGPNLRYKGIYLVSMIIFWREFEINVHSIFYEIFEKPIYEFKRNLVLPLEDDPIGAFSQVYEGILYMEDVRAYIYCKFENIEDMDIFTIN